MMFLLLLQICMIFLCGVLGFMFARDMSYSTYAKEAAVAALLSPRLSGVSV